MEVLEKQHTYKNFKQVILTKYTNQRVALKSHH